MIRTLKEASARVRFVRLQFLGLSALFCLLGATASNAQASFVGDEADPITPIEIRHSVDAIHNEDGDLEQYYNFIVYTFTDGSAHAWARTYLDEVRVVTVYGPFDAPRSGNFVSAPEFEQAIAGYLGRRFSDVQFVYRRERRPVDLSPVPVPRIDED